ncbi:MAG: ATP-binding protein [Candidatus Limnocylindrales bacterium]
MSDGDHVVTRLRGIGRHLSFSRELPRLAPWPSVFLAIGAGLAAGVLKGAVYYGAEVDTWLPYVPALAIVAWVSGLPASLITTAVGAIIEVVFFIEPRGQIFAGQLGDYLRILLLLAAGLTVGGITGRLRVALTTTAEMRRQAANAASDLRRSRDQLAAVLDGVRDGIAVLGDDFGLLYANDEAARLFGFTSADEMIAMSPDAMQRAVDLFDDDGDPVGFDELPSRLAMRGEHGPERLVRSRIHRSGEERWLILSSTPIFEEGGQVRFVVSIFRDVTEQRRREDGERFLADATAVLAVTLDERTTIGTVADIAVQRLADWCVIDLVLPDGTVETALAHSEAVADGLSPAIRARFANDRSTGSKLVSDASGDDTVEGNIRSYLRAPLVSPGRNIGAVTLLTGESRRRLEASDLAVATELGQRAGVALEHRRLYRLAEARRGELTAVLAAMGEAVLVFDASGRLLLRNPAAQELLGESMPDSLTRLRRWLGLGAGLPAPWQEDSDPAPVEIRRDDGRWLEVSTYRARGDDGAATPTGSVARADAPHGIEAGGDEELRGSTILLVRDVSTQRQAQAAREAFIGLLSHELRTPITTIYGGTRLLERPLREDQRNELVRDIRVEAERLYRLVEDLLVMTRIERGGVEIGDEPLLLQRMLGPIVHAEEARWPGLRVELSMPPRLPAVRGESTYVEQVVRNLLTNAAKYAGVDEPVELVATDEDDEVVVQVLDRGPGFQADDAERIFELFYRASSTAGTASGAGIGLFVCRALVTAMGGRMWAEARPDGGATFAFSLPVLESDELA